jgi:hypothetical protein
MSNLTLVLACLRELDINEAVVSLDGSGGTPETPRSITSLPEQAKRSINCRASTSEGSMNYIYTLQKEFAATRDTLREKDDIIFEFRTHLADRSLQARTPTAAEGIGLQPPTY